MKLLTRYNRVNVVVTIVGLVISAVCYYMFLRTVLVHQLDKDLKVEENEVRDYIRENNRLPEPTSYKDEQEAYFPASDTTLQRSFSSVNIYSRKHSDFVAYRQLEFVVRPAGKYYKVQIRKSQEETEDLIELILKITLGLALLLLASLFLVNRFILSKLWKPFHATLAQLKKFNLSERNNIRFETSDIAEFNELNEAASIMINRANQDYEEIKNFTENASHEIQTPLAIIKSKLELLSQFEGLRETEMNTLQSIYEATNRLSRLNNSLILLTKIDNNQFQEKEEVNIGELIKKQLIHYEELIAAKPITVTTEFSNDVTISMNEALAEIMVSNLLTNAIKHNVDNGTMHIGLNNARLTISNSGSPLNVPPSALFERFTKDKVTSESLGLGLSIVKKICDLYHFRIEYTYSEGLHQAVITF